MKTLLVGNGINRALGGSHSWGSLLKEITGRINLGDNYLEDKDLDVEDKKLKDSSFTVEFERIANFARLSYNPENPKELFKCEGEHNIYTNSFSNNNEVVFKIIKKIVADIMKTNTQAVIQNKGIESFPDIYPYLHKRIMTLSNVDNVLTTNYDFLLEGAINEEYSQPPLLDIVKYGEFGLSHTLTPYHNNPSNIPIYHIHGEIEHYNSIILGQIHYLNLVKEIMELTDISSKEKNKTEESWIHLFLDEGSDIDILGFGFDLAEIDLWYLLDCRLQKHRINASSSIKEGEKCGNRIRYFDVEIKPWKKNLLESYNVEVIEAKDIPGYTFDNKYAAFYDRVLDFIENEEEISR